MLPLPKYHEKDVHTVWTLVSECLITLSRGLLALYLVRPESPVMCQLRVEFSYTRTFSRRGPGRLLREVLSDALYLPVSSILGSVVGPVNSIL